MPANAADIALATREYEVDTRSDATVLARHPNARGTTEEPRIGFWDSVGNAAVIGAIGFALIGTERRRAAVVVFDELDFSGALAVQLATPTATVVDAEASLNTAMLISRIEVDEQAGTTSLEVFG